MSYETNEKSIFSLLERNDIEIDEVTYLEKEIDVNKLLNLKELIVNWKFHTIANEDGKVCIIGEEKNPQRYITITIKQSTDYGYYKWFVPEYLAGCFISYDEMLTLLSGETTFMSYYIETTLDKKIIGDNRFETATQIEIFQNEIKIGEHNPIIRIYEEEIDFIRNVGSVIPTRYYALENCVEVYKKNGNRIELYYTVY